MAFKDTITSLRSYGIGWLIAVVVLILAIVCWFLDKPLTPKEVIGFIIALALALLL